MAFMLQKYVSFLLTPLSLIILLTLLALFTKKAKRKKGYLLSILVILLFFSNPFIFRQAASLWSIKTEKIEDISTKYDIGVVMGGYIWTPGGTNLIHTVRSGNRLLAAIQLYHADKINKIFLTGGYFDISKPEEREAPIARRFLILNGIPTEDIIIEEKAKNTYENAQFSSKILKTDFPNKKYLLITSNYHMRRSFACFEKAGVPVVPFATGRSYGNAHYDVSHFLPSDDTLFSWSDLIHEMISFTFYYLKGYL